MIKIELKYFINTKYNYNHEDKKSRKKNENIQINQQDIDGNTPLMWASRKGHKEIVQMLLLDKSIQLNKQDK